jgi:hypothetical protein
MQAGRGFILFLIGKPARGLALIEMEILKITVFVIKQDFDQQ